MALPPPAALVSARGASGHVRRARQRFGARPGRGPDRVDRPPRAGAPSRSGNLPAPRVPGHKAAHVADRFAPAAGTSGAGGGTARLLLVRIRSCAVAQIRPGPGRALSRLCNRPVLPGVSTKAIVRSRRDGPSDPGERNRAPIGQRASALVALRKSAAFPWPTSSASSRAAAQLALAPRRSAWLLRRRSGRPVWGGLCWCTRLLSASTSCLDVVAALARCGSDGQARRAFPAVLGILADR